MVETVAAGRGGETMEKPFSELGSLRGVLVELGAGRW